MLSHFVFNETREDGKRQDGKNQRDFVPCEDTHLHEVFVCSFQLLLHQLQRKKMQDFPVIHVCAKGCTKLCPRTAQSCVPEAQPQPSK